MNGVGVSLERCVGDPKCKTSEEIDRYIDERGLNLVYYSNTVSYRQDKYGDETLNKEGVLTFDFIDSQYPKGINIEY